MDLLSGRRVSVSQRWAVGVRRLQRLQNPGRVIELEAPVMSSPPATQTGIIFFPFFLTGSPRSSGYGSVLKESAFSLVTVLFKYLLVYIIKVLHN